MSVGLRIKPGEVGQMLPECVDTLGYGFGCGAMELHPGLAGPELVAHMRKRASISSMARKGGGVASEGAIAGDLSWLIDDPDRTIADTALALFLTENRWAEPDQEFVLVDRTSVV